jgi:hypothetical protein
MEESVSWPGDSSEVSVQQQQSDFSTGTQQDEEAV